MTTITPQKAPEAGASQHPRFDVGVTPRMLALLVAIVLMAAVALYFYGQFTPGV